MHSVRTTLTSGLQSKAKNNQIILRRETGTPVSLFMYIFLYKKELSHGEFCHDNLIFSLWRAYD